MTAVRRPGRAARAAAAGLLLVGGSVAAQGPAWAGGSTGSIARASVSADGKQGKEPVLGRLSLSQDGVRVAFLTESALVAADTNGGNDVYVKNLTTGNIVCATTDSRGKQPDEFSHSVFDPSLSGDGKKVAFATDNVDLVPGGNFVFDVYVKDIPTRAITRVSTSSAGKAGNGASLEPSLSAHGGKVAFSSAATNLVPGDKNKRSDVFVKDLKTGAVMLASSTAEGVAGSGTSSAPSLSADGTRVAFVSSSSNLVPGDKGNYDIFVKDLKTGAIVWSTVDGTKGRMPMSEPVLSADGTRLAFTTDADNVVPGDYNETSDVFVKDLKTGTLTRVSTSAAGVQGPEEALHPSFSADGSHVAFMSGSPDLLPDDTNFEADIFVRNLDTGTLALVSTTSGGGHGDAESTYPALSQDGRRIAFSSIATNLVPGDTNKVADVFVKDLS